MTKEQIDSEISSYSDEELIAETEEAKECLDAITDEERDSEWHQACFAAMFLFYTEMNKRNLNLPTPNNTTK